MTNPATPTERTPSAQRAPQRQVTLPRAAKRRQNVRGGLLLLGLVLMLASAGGFWYVLQSVDERQAYLMTARTIERWDMVTAADFVIVEANPGDAVGVPAAYADLVLGKLAAGRIPARTLVTLGMFQDVPLSSTDEAAKVLIEINLPAGEAPFDALEAGDRLALFGAETSADAAEGAPAALIGVLTVDFVDGDTLVYMVTPQEAKDLQAIVDRYAAATERRIWKLGADIAVGDLVDLYGGSMTTPAVADGFLADGGAVTDQ